MENLTGVHDTLHKHDVLTDIVFFVENAELCKLWTA